MLFAEQIRVIRTIYLLAVPMNGQVLSEHLKKALIVFEHWK
jgi:hypothetical protein